MYRSVLLSLILVSIVVSSLVITSYYPIGSQVSGDNDGIATIRFNKIALSNGKQEIMYNGSIKTYIYLLDVLNEEYIPLSTEYLVPSKEFKIDLRDYIAKCREDIKYLESIDAPSIPLPQVRLYMFVVYGGEVYGTLIGLKPANIESFMKNSKIPPLIVEKLVLKKLPKIPLYNNTININYLGKSVETKIYHYVPHATDCVGDEFWAEVATSSCTNCIPYWWIQSFKDEFSSNGVSYAKKAYKVFAEFQGFLLDDLIGLPQNGSVISLTDLGMTIYTWLTGDTRHNPIDLDIETEGYVPIIGLKFTRDTNENPFIDAHVVIGVAASSKIVTGWTWYGILGDTSEREYNVGNSKSITYNSRDNPTDSFTRLVYVKATRKVTNIYFYVYYEEVENQDRTYYLARLDIVSIDVYVTTDFNDLIVSDELNNDFSELYAYRAILSGIPDRSVVIDWNLATDSVYNTYGWKPGVLLTFEEETVAELIVTGLLIAVGVDPEMAQYYAEATIKLIEIGYSEYTNTTSSYGEVVDLHVSVDPTDYTGDLRLRISVWEKRIPLELTGNFKIVTPILHIHVYKEVNEPPPPPCDPYSGNCPLNYNNNTSSTGTK